MSPASTDGPGAGRRALLAFAELPPSHVAQTGVAGVARFTLTAAPGCRFAARVPAPFLGRPQGRGQAPFTVIGYGFGGMTGVTGMLAGSAAVKCFGIVPLLRAARVLAVRGRLCARRAIRADAAPSPPAAL